MTVESPTSQVAGDRPAPAPAAYDQGAGWLTFAGVMLVIVGIQNIVGGIAAIDNANFYVGNAQFILGDLNGLGWVLTILGVGQILTAFALWARSDFARAMGVIFASLNAIAQLIALPAYPLWSVAAFTLDILIIYGLLAYRGRTHDAV